MLLDKITEDTTDREKIREVFKLLRKQGVTCKMTYKCCMGCGCAALAAEGVGDDDPYLFFHQQDAESFDSNGYLRRTLYIRHGGDAARLAKVAFEAIGMKVDWDGTETMAFGLEATVI